MPHKCELGFLLVVTVHKEADEGIEDYGSHLPQRPYSLPHALPMPLSPAHSSAAVADDKQDHDARDPHRGVDLGLRQGPKRVDGDQVRRLTRADGGYAQGSGDLREHDGDARRGGEGGDGDVGDEVDEPAEAEHADGEGEDGAEER
jgi:hypothetical protein